MFVWSCFHGNQKSDTLFFFYYFSPIEYSRLSQTLGHPGENYMLFLMNTAFKLLYKKDTFS